jgi:hypothetical protein
VTKDGCEVITRLPVRKIAVAGTHYFTSGENCPTTREDAVEFEQSGALERVRFSVSIDLKLLN